MNITGDHHEQQFGRGRGERHAWRPTAGVGVPGCHVVCHGGS